MSSEILFIAGGVTLAAVLLTFLILKSRSGKESLISATDDQLIVSEVSSSDITSWFKEKNPEGKLTNVVMLVSDETLGKMHLPADVINSCSILLADSKNVILQAIVNKESDKVELTRAVIFETMSEKLGKLLMDNNGVLIIE